MRKEPIVVAVVLLTFAVVAFVMAWLKHDELMNGEVVEALAVPRMRPVSVAIPIQSLKPHRKTPAGLAPAGVEAIAPTKYAMEEDTPSH